MGKHKATATDAVKAPEPTTGYGWFTPSAPIRLCGQCSWWATDLTAHDVRGHKVVKIG